MCQSEQQSEEGFGFVEIVGFRGKVRMGSKEECPLDWVCLGHSRVETVGHRREVGQGRVFVGVIVEGER